MGNKEFKVLPKSELSENSMYEIGHRFPEKALRASVPMKLGDHRACHLNKKMPSEFRLLLG